ncbi:MAG: trypsin-like serine protease [Flavobacteriaceae bacterium]|nr:MAG: trypsin-like serine protease [Flavobacteriaceae bacterium]
MSSDIVRRHDRADADYINLGKSFKAVVKVGLRGGDGTLIAPNWVITAAHVAKGIHQRDGKNFQVYFGNDPIGFRVKQVFIHPNFQPMKTADIALLWLEKEVPNIDPILPYVEQDESGKQIIIVGHGDTKTGKDSDWISDGLKRGATNIIDEVTSDKIIFDFDQPQNGTALEGTAGRGDSGGPAIILVNDIPMIAGISSAGMPGKNGPGTYGAIEHYTRISSYVEWIEGVINNPVREMKSTKVQKPTTSMQSDAPIPGLGLFMRQDGNKIRIGGKVDPQVPESFREVLFKPPSFLKSFNGKVYESLEQFKNDFDELTSGDEFKIAFEVKGEELQYEARKM